MRKLLYYERTIDFKNKTVTVTPVYIDGRRYFSFGCIRIYDFK